MKDLHLHHIGRESFLSPLVWNEDGWPVVNGNGTIDFEMDAPLPGPAPVPASVDFCDNFDGERLDLRWTFVRNPKRENYILRNGHLDLIAGKDELSTELGAPTMIAARQTEFDMQVTAKMQGEIGEGQRSGITAFYNSYFHYDIYVTKQNGAHCVCLRKRVADIDTVVASHEIDYKGEIQFKIESDESLYRFFYEKDGAFVELGSGKTSLLATEATNPMTFTGTFWGAFTEQGDISLDSFEVKQK